MKKCLLILIVIVSFLHSSHAIVLTGKVVDSLEAPVLRASIIAFSGLRKLNLVPEPVRTYGSFTFTVVCPGCSHVRITIQAKGFQEKNVTLLVQDNKIDL